MEKKFVSWPVAIMTIMQFLVFSPSLLSHASALESEKVLSIPMVGTSINIRVDSLANALPAVAYNSDQDEFLVVWGEEISGAEVAIYGQRVGSDGQLRGNAVTIKREVNKPCYFPSAAYSPVQKKFLVVYRYNFSSSDYDIRATPVSGDGTSVGPEITIDGRTGWQWAAKTTYNSQSDEFLVVYENYLSSTDRQILAARVKASDMSLPAPPVVIAYVSGQSRRLPDAAYNVTRNEYLIAYTHHQNVNIYGIKGKIVPADLSTVPSAEKSFTTNDQCDGVSLAAGPDEYLAVWSENAVGGPEKIWGRRITGPGTLEPFIKFADRAPDNCIEAAADYSPYWGYMVTWRLSYSGIWDIFARILLAGANDPSGGEFPVSYIAYSSGGGYFFSDGQQKSPAVACGDSGICLVAYEDNCCLLNTGNDYEIRGRLLSPNFIYLPLIKK